MDACQHSLDLKESLISTDQLLYHQDMKSKFQKMLTTLNPLIADDSDNDDRVSPGGRGSGNIMEISNLISYINVACTSVLYTHTVQICTPGFVVESLPPIFPPLQVAHGSDTYPRAARRSQVGLDPHRMSAILFSSISGATWHHDHYYTHTSSQTCDVMLYLLFLCITIKICNLWLFWSVGLSKHDQLSFQSSNWQLLHLLARVPQSLACTDCAPTNGTGMYNFHWTNYVSLYMTCQLACAHERVNKKMSHPIKEHHKTTSTNDL